MISAREPRELASPERPRVGDAAGRVYEAGQALLERRLEFLMVQVRAILRGSVGFGLAAVFALAGWFLFVAGLIDALARDYPRFAVQMSVGAAHLALAAALFWASRRVADGGRT
jgi:hypothetical protein